MGTANDSPYPKRMISAIPPRMRRRGRRCRLRGKKNCSAVQDSGRKPVIRPKKNYSVRGSGARAEMLQFYEEHPRTFHNALCDRNNVENDFSVMKERFGAAVRALAERTQSIEVLSMVICFNMLARGPCPESGAEPRPSDYEEAAHDVPWTAIMATLRQLGRDFGALSTRPAGPDASSRGKETRAVLVFGTGSAPRMDYIVLVISTMPQFLDKAPLL